MDDPHHVYLDLDVINNDYKHDGSPPYLRFEEIRNTPFLDGDSSEYFCSIMRFTIQTGNTLPVFLPRVAIQNANTPPLFRPGLNQLAQNMTIYTVSLAYTYSDTDYIQSAPVIYIPEDKTSPLPSPPYVKQDFSSKYYYIYNYRHFIDMINTALNTSFANLRDALPKIGAASPIDATVAPYLDFDPLTNRAVLHADQTFYDDTWVALSGIQAIKIYFNERLYDLLIGLPFEHVAETGELNYRLRVLYNNSNLVPKNVLVVIPPEDLPSYKKINFVQMSQEVSSIALWNPVASIVFASSLLPIQATQTSLPKDVGNSNNNFTGSGNNSNLLSAITDFTIAVDGNNQYRPMIVYNPAAEYRLIDMCSSMNMNRIDIIVYWKDTFGNIHPFELHPGCSANVKILFRRKDFNTNN